MKPWQDDTAPAQQDEEGIIVVDEGDGLRAREAQPSGKPPKPLKGWMLEFLEYFANTANKGEAAKLSRISVNTVDRLRLTNPEFLAAYKRAEKQAVEKLEGIVFNRAMNGDRRLKFDPKTGKPYVDPETGEAYEEREFSDTLQLTLLKAHKPEVYRERLDLTVGIHQPLTAEDRAARLLALKRGEVEE